MDEITCLKAKIDLLQGDLNEAIVQRDHLSIELSAREQEIEALNQQVAHLKGQIDAYQYCMNCRR